MVKEILTAAGVPFRQGRFPDPPTATYAIYFDNVEADGADWLPTAIASGLPCVYHHDVTVEVYESKPDDAIESAIEAALTAQGFPWTKEDRYWLQNVQRYQVIYEFSYTDK